jgi:hypothetical protein
MGRIMILQQLHERKRAFPHVFVFRKFVRMRTGSERHLDLMVDASRYESLAETAAFIAVNVRLESSVSPISGTDA